MRQIIRLFVLHKSKWSQDRKSIKPKNRLQSKTESETRTAYGSLNVQFCEGSKATEGDEHNEGRKKKKKSCEIGNNGKHVRENKRATDKEREREREREMWVSKKKKKKVSMRGFL